jgi:hypothetical protein
LPKKIILTWCSMIQLQLPSYKIIQELKSHCKRTCLTLLIQAWMMLRTRDGWLLHWGLNRKVGGFKLRCVNRLSLSGVPIFFWRLIASDADASASRLWLQSSWSGAKTGWVQLHQRHQALETHQRL